MLGYGNVIPAYVAPPARGVFGGGYDSESIVVNVIDYITISSTGNASDFVI